MHLRHRKLLIVNLLAASVLALAGCGKDDETVSIVVTSDMNGDTALIGKAAALRDSLDEDQATFLVDCGNTLSGSTASVASNGKNIADIMTKVDYDAAVLSGKDVDCTGDLLISDEFDLAYLANDLRVTSDSSMLCSSRIVKITDCKIGFLGITDSNGNDLFSTLADDELYKVLNEYTTQFESEKCDMTILAVSSGDKALCEELASKVKNIDIIISSGSDTNKTEESNGVYIVYKSMNSTEAGVIICDEGEYEIEYRPLNNYEISAELEPTINTVSEDSKIIAECSQSMSGDTSKNETVLGDLVAQSVNCITKTDGTLIDGSLITGGLNKGNVTTDDLCKAVSEASIVRVELSGKELLKILQESVDKQTKIVQSCGIIYTIDTSSDPNTVRVVSVNNKLFNEDDKYTITACLPDHNYGELSVKGVSATLRTAMYRYIVEELGGKIGEQYSGTAGMITYVDSSETIKGANVIGLYRHDKATHIRYLVDDTEGVFTAGENIISFDSIAGADKSYNWQDYKGEYRKLFYSYPDSESSKIGYKIAFTLEDGSEHSYVITNPEDTEPFFEYIEAYIYDDINQPDGAWYSHLTKDQMTDKTLMTSIKLHGGAKVGQVKEIWLTNFIYNGDKDFNSDSGEYIGRVSYMVDIHR